ncbi:MAG: fimbrial biogenesis outer membrane usher protein [bacterium]|nr:fimbrial biogenesis outer membrane usher protein [bacterium]
MLKIISAKILVVLIIAGAFPVANASETVILKVIANGHNEGRHFLGLAPDGDILISPEFLVKLRLRGELWRDIKKDRISLRSLAPKLKFQVDHNNAILNLTVAPECFEPQIIRRPETEEPSPSTDSRPSRPFAAFFNYRLQGDFTEDKVFDTYNIPWEIGVNWKKWFAFSSFQHTRSVDDSDTSRLMTNMIWDDPESMKRLMLGDINARSTNLLGGILLGGVSWESRFALDHEFKPYPGTNFETLLESPAHAELLSNGHVLREWDLLPGPVSFTDMDVYGGDELVLRDAYGRERHLSLPSLFRGRSLLDSGLHEYSYNIGAARENFGQGGNSYKEITAIGFHRYGYNNMFTPGFGFLAQKDILNIGPMIGIRLGQHNLMDIETQYSNSRGEDGYAVSGNHTFRLRRFSSHLSLRQYSRNFTALSATSVKYQGNLSLSYNWDKWGGLNLGYSEIRNWEETQDHSALMTLTYQKNLFKCLSMSFTVRKDVSGPENEEFSVRFNYIPNNNREKKYYNSMGYQFRDTKSGDDKHELRVQKNSGSGKGFGYNLAINEEGGDTGGSVRAEYRDELTILAASCRRSADNTSGELSLAGGIGFFDTGLYFGRPVIDSFAVVEVEGLDNVPIYQNNSLAGIAGKDNPLLIPSLSSYQESRISIRPKDLPINFEFVEREQSVKMGQRGGALVTFKAFKFMAVEGNLYLTLPDGGRKSLSTMPVEIEVDGQKRTSFTGQDGYFYLENLPIGEHLLRVRRSEGDCEVSLTITESDEIVRNRGDLPCIPVKAP